MKKLLLTLVLLVGLNTFAQDGTTQKELTYLTSAYKEDLKTGRDIISGYEAVLMVENTTNTSENNKSVTRSSSLFKFVRTETGKIAAFILVDERKDTGYSSYTIIPNINSTADIWTKAREVYLAKVIKESKCENLGPVFAYSWNNLMLLSKLNSN